MKLIGIQNSPRCCKGKASNWSSLEHIWKNGEPNYFSLLLLFKLGNERLEQIQGNCKAILVLSAIMH